MVISVCVGSSCHLKGSYDIIEAFKSALAVNNLADKITLKAVIELIDGPIAIVRCLESSETCSMNSDKTSCIYHHIFDKISLELAAKLQSITILDVMNKNFKL